MRRLSDESGEDLGEEFNTIVDALNVVKIRRRLSSH